MPHSEEMEVKQDSAIDEMLQVVGEIADVDRAYLFQYSKDKKLMSCTNEWCACEVSSHKHRLGELETNTFPWYEDFKSSLIL